jgi:hypothetical protein
VQGWVASAGSADDEDWQFPEYLDDDDTERFAAGAMRHVGEAPTRFVGNGAAALVV